jgi:DnaJ domain
VTHYEVLGVDPGASTDEIHRAYLAAARRHHPDRFAAGGRDESDDRMREVNAAWAILSDGDRRGLYDLTLGSGGARRSGHVADLDDTFVPYDDGDDLDFDDDWRYEPDVGDPRTAPSRRVVLAPVVLGALAILMLVAWMLLDDDRLGAAAGFLGVLTLISFVLVPVVAMARAARFERP